MTAHAVALVGTVEAAEIVLEVAALNGATGALLPNARGAWGEPSRRLWGPPAKVRASDFSPYRACRVCGCRVENAVQHEPPCIDRRTWDVCWSGV